MTDKTLTKRKPNELREIIEGADFRAQLLKALPNGMSPERFVRIAVTSMMRNPKLMQTTRETFFRCLLDLGAMGLEPDGRQAHLIPRKNRHTNAIDCTLVVDYKGLKELMYRNGDIIDEHSDYVGDMDFFEYEFGSNKRLIHRPNVMARGKIFCAYSHVTLPRGGQTFDVMSIDEIELIRKRSASPDSGPWVTDYLEMCKKTVFRRLSKSLPLSPKTRDAIETDQTYDIVQEPAATPMRAVVGGTRRELAPEEDGEMEAPADLPSEPEPSEPAGVHQEPQERVSEESKVDKAPGPLTTVRARLKEAGYRPDEFLTLLKAVRLAPVGVKDISQVTPAALKEALGDWENCLKRLEIERANAKNPQPVQPDDFPA
jgi:recombination protein RecT